MRKRVDLFRQSSAKLRVLSATSAVKRKINAKNAKDYAKEVQRNIKRIKMMNDKINGPPGRGDPMIFGCRGTPTCISEVRCREPVAKKAAVFYRQNSLYSQRSALERLNVPFGCAQGDKERLVIPMTNGLSRFVGKERSLSNWHISNPSADGRNDEHEGNVMLNLFQHLCNTREISLGGFSILSRTSIEMTAG